MSVPVVNLAVPIRGTDINFGTALGLMYPTAGKCSVVLDNHATSVLPYTFNLLWARALNRREKHGVTHFAMIHADIVPEQHWLDTLMGILVAEDADIVSAVVPIKDERGMTSTALDSRNPWLPRALSLHEVFQLPGDTFTDPAILLNTGLWVCRMDRPWVDAIGGFRQTDELVNENGQYVARTMSEDWDFSRRARKLGCKLIATRRVGLHHERPEFHNRSAWGTWRTDTDI